MNADCGDNSDETQGEHKNRKKNTLRINLLVVSIRIDALMKYSFSISEAHKFLLII